MRFSGSWCQSIDLEQFYYWFFGPAYSDLDSVGSAQLRHIIIRDEYFRVWVRNLLTESEPTPISKKCIFNLKITFLSSRPSPNPKMSIPNYHPSIFIRKRVHKCSFSLLFSYHQGKKQFHKFLSSFHPFEITK